MAEKPILFSAPMVRALLRRENPKTQTRRIIKPEPSSGMHWNAIVVKGYGGWCDGHGSPRPCRYGEPGDLLWVRETWRPAAEFLSQCASPKDIRFAASVSEAEWATSKWKPAIHMPRWASRISLRVTNVRAERVQEVSDADAVAEGATPALYRDLRKPKDYFRELWEHINGRESWEANPWVWVVSFERLSSQHRAEPT